MRDVQDAGRRNTRAWQIVAASAALVGACAFAAYLGIFLEMAARQRPGVTAAAASTPTATPGARFTPVATWTSAPAAPPVSGARLGGPVSAFDAVYGPSDGHGTYDFATIQGQSVTIISSVTDAGESADGVQRVLLVDLAPTDPNATWSPSVAAAIARSFLPPDARHTRDVATDYGLDHRYTSARLAASLTPSAFAYPDSSPAPAGFLDWACHITPSGRVDSCEVAA